MSDTEQQQQQPAEAVVLPATTEHQVGETEDGQPIMGRDRGAVDFGAAAAVGGGDAPTAQPQQPPQQQQQGSQANSRTSSVSAPAVAPAPASRRDSVAVPPPPPPRSNRSSVSSNGDHAVHSANPVASPIALPPLRAPPANTAARPRSDSPARVTPIDDAFGGTNDGINKSPNTMGARDATALVVPADDDDGDDDVDDGINNDAALVEPAAVAPPPPPAEAVAVPGVSQRHLYQFDEEYETALAHYDADVMSSEAASRFAVGIHSTAASATRHFADFCELQSDEAARLVDRRNKKADTVRANIKQELLRYGFAGVAQELAQMTGVLIDDHRRRIELLADRVRLQLKSTLSQILREQEHAGEALRAEFVKTASVEFAQDSLLELIGIAPDTEEKKKARLEREMEQLAASKQQQQQSARSPSEEAAAEANAAAAASSSSPASSAANSKGKKAANEVYANELQKRLSAIFDKQTGFAVRKAQTIVGSAKANFTRLADQLSKIEDDNIRRLLMTRERTEKHISDLEVLAANSARKRIVEGSELELDLQQKTAELKRLRERKEEVEREVREQERARAERRKTSYGMTAGGLMMGGGALDHLLGSNNNNNQSRSRYGDGVDGSGVYSSGSPVAGGGGRSKTDREMDEKLKSATLRSQALADKNAARLQGSRDRQAQQALANKSRDMSFGRRAGSGGGGARSNNANNRSGNKTSGSTPNSPSLSHRNVGRIGGEQLSATEKARRHIMGDGPDAAALMNRLETREIDPKEAVLIHKRRPASGGAPAAAASGAAGSPGSGRQQQDAWIESEALRALAMRTARHGLSFPDGADPIVPTHKFLDDELAAIYELRHLRSPNSSATASRAAAVAAAQQRQKSQENERAAASQGRYF